ncbi:cobalamin biosynthesis protein CobW [Thiomicrorhabdus immobilis]|uniref:Cobalamin biosynthesis protein CobW n=1 Tax=Thiomicrorhabdus immobilis TaxID=2791037 RepID=A0ABM7MF56_9GAMM|nr:GTP-binding protein [Thiomicrorhabdus immobilis]BCN94046.1 cobalamin biosynthesis protein CobW [Thiomicrorhabdus immobilis]
MFQSIQKQTAVNLITGSLGAGKTTLLKNLIKQKPDNESWAILVNEFGAIGIDGAILEQNKEITVAQIPGGCICCTAQNELKDAIEQLLKVDSFDRLFIEPTGLGEPDILVDLLQSPFFQKRFDVQTVFAVLDASNTSVKEIELYTIIQNLLNMADVVVLNKSDLASEEQLLALQDYCKQLYPPKTAVLSTNHSQIDARHINLTELHSLKANQAQNFALSITQQTISQQNQPNSASPSAHLKSADKTAFDIQSKVELPGLVNRQSQNQLGTISVGWIFNDSVEFDWKVILKQFEKLNDLGCANKPLRAKGVFKVGKPWMLFQWVNEQTSRELIAHRRDSRIEILLPENTEFDFESFEKGLKKSQKT